MSAQPVGTVSIARAPRERLSAHAAELVLAGALALAAALLLFETRGLIFYYDEWTFLLERRANDLDAFLAPHNEHPVLVPVILWKALWTTTGTADYLPYRLMAIALHLLVCVLLFLVARRRVGAPLAVVPAVILAFFGPAFASLLWPFQVTFLVPVACALGSLLALDRKDARGDWLASGLVTIALFSSGLGVPVAVGTAVDVLLRPDRLRRAVRVLALPILLFAPWYLVYGVRSPIVPGNIAATPQLVMDSAAANLAALVGLTWEWGRPLAYGFLAVIAWRLTRRQTTHARLFAVLTTMLAFWALQGSLRGGSATPPPSHYLYPGAVFVLLVVIELAPRRVPRPTPRAAAVAAVLTGAVVLSNVGVLHDGGWHLRTISEIVAAELGALELSRGHVASDFQPDLAFAPQVAAGKYFAAIDASGSIADSPDGIARRPEAARQAADVTLVRALRVVPRPVSDGGSGVAPVLERVTGGRTRTQRGCLVWLPAPGGSAVEVQMPSTGVVLHAGTRKATVALRRFGSGYVPAGEQPAAAAFAGRKYRWGAWRSPYPYPRAPELRVAPGTSAHLLIPSDATEVPWHARIDSAARVSICGRG